MSERSESEHPRVTFLRALAVGRNARAGFGIGILFASLVFVWFVYIPERPDIELPWYLAVPDVVLWLMLAAVLAVGTGLLLTVTFTLGSAVHLARDLD